MKKSLIALAVIAASGQALAIATADKLTGIPHKPQQPKLAENDDALWLKPIMTREMLAGTQQTLDQRLKQSAIKKTLIERKPHFIGEQPGQILADRKPVHIQVDKKPRYDKRPIHIGGGCSDIGGGSSDDGPIKRSIPDGSGLQQHAVSHAAALA